MMSPLRFNTEWRPWYVVAEICDDKFMQRPFNLCLMVLFYDEMNILYMLNGLM